MASLEIDPLLRKGFHLLHSRSRDSADQLKALLEEAHRQRLGKSVQITKQDPFSIRKESPVPRSKQASPSNITLSKGTDLKREIALKVTRDDDSHIPKRPRLDSPHSAFKSHTPSPTPSVKSESSTKSRKSDESDSDADMNDLAMEIGINCTVCKSFEQTSGNQLVECQECHSLYHQECHKPAVTHQDVTDPRLVWYCAKCSRTIKKQSSLLASSGGGAPLGSVRAAAAAVASNTVVSSKSGTSHSNSSRPSPSKGTGLQRPSPFANLSSVSGRTVGSSSSSSGSSSNGSSGNSSSRSAVSSSSGTRSSTGPPAANSIMNAERRVHLMKKKAAKNAERRKII